MNIIVSGSKGFIGSNLLELIKDKKYSLITIDIEDDLDLSKYEELSNIQKFDVFIHLANISFVPESFLYPEKFLRINFLTTLNALELCRKYRARLIYLSSYIYGEPEYLPVDEMHPLKPFNPYAQSKLLCENLCDGYLRDFDIKTTILRPFNVYGVGQNNNLLIPEIFRQINEGSGIVKLKDPSPRRDYVNVKDVAIAIMNCLESTNTFGKYNVCSGISYSVKEITEIINNNLRSPVSFEFDKSNRSLEVNETLGSFEKLKKDFCWTPSVTFEEGIKAIIKSFNL